MNNDRHALVERYMPLAHKLAYEKKRRLPRHIDIEELQSAAYLGLVESANRFEFDKGVAFTTFAYRRISGAINDYLRSLGMVNALSLDSSGGEESCLKETLESKSEKDFGEVLEVVTRNLDEQAKVVLSYYVVDEMSMKEVGNRLGVTEGRVSQIFASCKRQIRSRWERSELIEEIAA